MLEQVLYRCSGRFYYKLFNIGIGRVFAKQMNSKVASVIHVHVWIKKINSGLLVDLTYMLCLKELKLK